MRRLLSLLLIHLTAFATFPAAAAEVEHFVVTLASWPRETRVYALELAAHPELARALRDDAPLHLESYPADTREAAHYFLENRSALDQLARNSDLARRIGDYYHAHPTAARAAVREIERDPNRVRSILGDGGNEGFLVDQLRKKPALAREQAKLLKARPQWRDEAWNSESRTGYVLKHADEYPEYSAALNRYADEHPQHIESRWRNEATKRRPPKAELRSSRANGRAEKLKANGSRRQEIEEQREKMRRARSAQRKTARRADRP